MKNNLVVSYNRKFDLYKNVNDFLAITLLLHYYYNIIIEFYNDEEDEEIKQLLNVKKIIKTLYISLLLLMLQQSF